MASANPFFAYYASQTGGGAPLPYYSSRFRVQAGRGWFGNLFRSAWSYLRPLVSNAAKQAGAEAMHVGSNIMQDVLANPNEPMKSVIGRHGKEGLMSIAKAAAAGARPERQGSWHTSSVGFETSSSAGCYVSPCSSAAPEAASTQQLQHP